jgi:hypothetical protein
MEMRKEVGAVGRISIRGERPPRHTAAGPDAAEAGEIH